MITQRDKGDKYGRMVGTIYTDGATLSINERMLNSGHAVPYPASLSHWLANNFD